MSTHTCVALQSVPFDVTAVGVVIGSLIYLISAIKGEEWRPVNTDNPNSAGGGQARYIVEPPQNPPPRRPQPTTNGGGDQRIYALS